MRVPRSKQSNRRTSSLVETRVDDREGRGGREGREGGAIEKNSATIRMVSVREKMLKGGPSPDCRLPRVGEFPAKV
jgi:hypothetical protein